MAYLRIYCDYCGQKWDVYERSIHDEKSRICPHCMAEIEPQTWSRQIVPALGMVSDANRELYKDHLGYHRPIFTVDVIADHIFAARRDTEEE